eukprot:NODE_4431_length_662_cov_73.730832_g3783_i0.p1 GENE.NODE_4431_length_662_cov_73.730832_g3783_i0~~NODE_4431_length_662_cov_73.730832_g3783_i0.p1  ORF type:complete len:192 (-),score=3.66 NODE_4431_length_662_cov_73.730832_g3783_i0:37-612(-)
MPKSYRTHSQTFKTPRRPYERERIDREIEKCGEFGLKNKREVWRVQLTLARIRKAARMLLTLEEGDQKRIFEGKALLKRMFKYGLLDKDTENGLDYILGLNIDKFLDRRLQTRVFRAKLADSIHNARTNIRGRHIAVDNQMVNVPSFLVTVDNEGKIQNHICSPYGGGKPGRWARARARAVGNRQEEEAEE